MVNKIPVPFDRIFFTEIVVQMVSTPFLRSGKTTALMLPCLIFNTLEWYDFYCATLTDRVVKHQRKFSKAIYKPQKCCSKTKT